MPGYTRAEVTAEIEVVTSPEAERSPKEQMEAVKQAAGETGLAHEAGESAMMLAGGRSEVLAAMTKVVSASLDAGARTIEIKVEAEGDSPRFGKESE